MTNNQKKTDDILSHLYTNFGGQEQVKQMAKKGLENASASKIHENYRTLTIELIKAAKKKDSIFVETINNKLFSQKPTFKLGSSPESFHSAINTNIEYLMLHYKHMREYTLQKIHISQFSPLIVSVYLGAINSLEKLFVLLIWIASAFNSDESKKTDPSDLFCLTFGGKLRKFRDVSNAWYGKFIGSEQKLFDTICDIRNGLAHGNYTLDKEGITVIYISSGRNEFKKFKYTEFLDITQKLNRITQGIYLGMLFFQLGDINPIDLMTITGLDKK